VDRAFAEAWTKRRSPKPVDVVVDRVEQLPAHRARLPSMEVPLIAIPLAAPASVDVVEIFWVADVQVDGVDAYNGAVFLVQLFDIP